LRLRKARMSANCCWMLTAALWFWSSRLTLAWSPAFMMGISFWYVCPFVLMIKAHCCWSPVSSPVLICPTLRPCRIHNRMWRASSQSLGKDRQACPSWGPALAPGRVLYSVSAMAVGMPQRCSPSQSASATASPMRRSRKPSSSAPSLISNRNHHTNMLASFVCHRCLAVTPCC
jgi:hypothetical protein